MQSVSCRVSNRRDIPPKTDARPHLDGADVNLTVNQVIANFNIKMLVEDLEAESGPFLFESRSKVVVVKTLSRFGIENK